MCYKAKTFLPGAFKHGLEQLIGKTNLSRIQSHACNHVLEWDGLRGTGR